MRRFLLALLAFCPAFVLAQAGAPTPRPAVPTPVWAYPVPKAAHPVPDPADENAPRRVPGSTVEYTKAQLRDLYAAPDWRPEGHGPMPSIVARGRNPGVFACAYCHQPTGTGRPENANLTGLTVGYITRQIADFRSGARKSSVAAMHPTSLMIGVAKGATETEVAEAARYFASLPATSLVSVVETDSVPRTEPRWMLVPVSSERPEPIGQRIIEVPRDLQRAELRDPDAAFLAYVPKGSIALGRTLARSTSRGAACVSCHGPDLKGLADIPRLAGRSPSYLVRQLIDFASGARAGSAGAPMVDVARRLSETEVIALAAYAASLAPQR